MLDDHFLIGVDGGGTHCRVAIATGDLQVVSQANGGAANVTSDYDLAIANIRATISKALEGAGLTETALSNAAAHLGLAGVMDQAMAERVVGDMPMARCVVTDDRTTTVAGVLGGRDGGVLAVGTGSFVGVSTQGQTRFVGGWGPVLGDQASGGWLGKRLLSHVCDAADGLAVVSPLTEAVLAEFNGTASDIVAFAATASPAEFARYAPRISQAATHDAVARVLMQDGAAYLTNALEALGYQPGQAVCAIGGLGQAYGVWLAPMVQADLVAPQGTALDGALHLALQACGE